MMNNAFWAPAVRFAMTLSLLPGFVNPQLAQIAEENWQ